MIEIIALVIVVGGIASFARGRGASPVVWGAAAAAGYVALAFIGPLLMQPVSDDGRLVMLVSAWAWLGIVALYVRFGIGRSYRQPDSKWSCQNCHFLNGRHAVLCEACGQPWSTQPQ